MHLTYRIEERPGHVALAIADEFTQVATEELDAHQEAAARVLRHALPDVDTTILVRRLVEQIRRDIRNSGAWSQTRLQVREWADQWL